MAQSGENYGAEMEKNVVKQGEAPWRAPRGRLVAGTSSGGVLGVLGRSRGATTGRRLLTGTEQARHRHVHLKLKFSPFHEPETGARVPCEKVELASWSDHYCLAMVRTRISTWSGAPSPLPPPRTWCPGQEERKWGK